MISYIFPSTLWSILIGLDFTISIRLARMYRRDNDIRKLMFIIGLIMFIHVYAIAIIGAESFSLARNMLEWSPIPLLLAFIFTSSHDVFNVDAKKCYRYFIIGTVVTIILFVIPIPNNSSQPFLITGTVLAVVLSIVQHLKKFDLPSSTLFLALPSFSISYIALGQMMVELALFAAFAANGTLLLAFEISKNLEGETSSILVLRKELHTAKNDFDKLFNILPDPAAIIDANGIILAVSPNVSAVSGFRKEELVGINFLKADLISDRSKFLMVQNLGGRIVGFEMAPYEVEIQSKDGKKRQYEVNTSKISYRGKPAAMVVFRDLTERNRLLEEIQREQMRFRDIAETTGDWIWEVDSEGKFTYSNSVVEKIFGYTVEEIIGKLAVEVFTSDEKNKSGVFPESAHGLKALSSMIRRCLHKDGRALTLENHIMPMYSVGGDLIGYRGVSRDFTEKEEMEKRLLKAERFAAIGELSTMVAHDLRNPLQGISNSIHFLEKISKNVENERLSLVIPLMNSALQHANKIVTELLDYSADIRLDLKGCEPKSIIEGALAGITIPNNINLIEKTQRRPRILVDSEKIERVLINLVSNAIDAMPDGGIIKIASKDTKYYFELSVADNGIGIPEEKMNKLWAPFITTKAKGVGLGLPICKKIVEAHGGRIKCESKKGKGTIFTLLLPIEKPKSKGVEFYIEKEETINSCQNKAGNATSFVSTTF